MPLNTSRPSPIAHIGAGSPVRRTARDDGTILTEKIPPQPYTRKMVSPSGNVSEIPMATGRTIGAGPNNQYGPQHMAKKKGQGFLLYSECPYATGWLPTPKGVKPCKGIHPIEDIVPNPDFNPMRPPLADNMTTMTIRSNTPGAYWRRANRLSYIEADCCEHMEPIIAARMAAQSEQQREFAAQNQTPGDRLHELKVMELEAEMRERNGEKSQGA